MRRHYEDLSLHCIRAGVLLALLVTTVLWFGSNSARGESSTIILAPRMTINLDSLASRVVFSPDGKLVATNQENIVRLWNAATGKLAGDLVGHTNGISSIAFDESGSVVATSSHDRTILLWNVATRKVVQTFEEQASVLAVAFVKGGKILASVSRDGTVRRWDVATGESLNKFVHPLTGVRYLAFSPDGSTLAFGGKDGVVSLWNVESGQSKATNQFEPQTLGAIAFSPDGETVAISWDKDIFYWNLASGKAEARWSGPKAIEKMAFSADGKKLAVAIHSDEGYAVQLLDSTSMETVLLLKGQDAISSITFSNDGKSIATSGQSDRTLQLWHTPSSMPAEITAASDRFILELKRAALTEADSGNGLSFSPDGNTLVSLPYDHVSLWDTVLRKRRKAISFNAGPSGVLSPRQSAFTPDGKRLLTYHVDGILRLWELKSAKLIHAIEHREEHMSVEGFSLGSQGQAMAVLVRRYDSGSGIKLNHDGYNRVELHNLNDHRVVSSFTIGDDGDDTHLSGDKSIDAIWFDDKTNTVAVCNQNSLRIIDAASGRTVRTLHDDFFSLYVPVLAASSDGRKLAVGNFEGDIRVWDVSSGRNLFTEFHKGEDNGVRALAFSPDGKKLISGYDSTTSRDNDSIVAFDLTTGDKLFTLPIQSIGSVDSIAFSPDGKTFATAGTGNDIRLWDTKSGSPKK